MTSADELEPAQHFVTIVISPDESRAEVTFQGNTQVVTGNAPKETRRDALDAVTRHALSLGRPVRVNARDSNGEWQLVVTPDGIVHAEGGEAPEHKLPKGPKAGRPPSRVRTALRVAGIGTLAVGLLAAVGGVVLWLLPDTVVEPSNGNGSSVTFDARPNPPGYGPEADWRTPTDPDSGLGVSPEGDRVGYIDREGQLVVAGPDGTAEWSAELPFDIADAEAPPQFVRDGDGYAVALVAEDVLFQWPEGGGDPVEYEVPSETAVSFAGSSALVSNDESAFVPVDGELREVPVEAPAGPLVADGERVLMAELNAVPWTWVAPDESVTEVDPDTPPGGDSVDQVITASTDHVVVRWTAESGDDVVLGVHDSTDGAIVASHATAPDEIDEARWVEGDTMAAYGPVLVNLDDGSTETVDGFEPLSATGDTVYGEIGGDPVAAGPDGEPVDLEENTARPWGLLDGRAVVVADDHLYALSPQ
ncbi:hypothetical protein F4561_002950 [Lipingzhangella halophila]|uniref:Uncharacterized protein n=1 Tax=Lipingzhangella halophila TaxID=1783352 RepID=A0A7W7W3X1_9ACTN|nr:hypothetical protein [Lipingzhangella halophila]MBB4932130.1 hypothetical protein [Lipingzhangella halophila]